ncbi:sulfatase-like hydrolase/transferase [Halorubrum ezzemoulense]|uniref:sulfatase-like hydrolase/transferase n=1 Tax=Halorubrum ezzemoulense TaxID=337243 RepID=UPI00232B19FD|nr:sulfatase-like hydrolase/transferase [Halorubrum ezzemoulense]MDB2248606.1 sulfatase-like hydrolase/transferase [Halorubrum ezzemoulense]MDB2276121.1 sulfatase-like hydrolase/transferase [Halorubrum ezzemoulense]
MDIIWIVLDSVSFDSTPFSSEGPDTMPKLESLARERGIIYTNAYAPGPTSPSSHSAFFTGKRPSVTGMYEANPYFTKSIDTIADSLSGHHSLAISSNPFIFNGLCEGFDVVDDLRNRDFMLFDDASDPITDGAQQYTESRAEQYKEFLFKKGKPVRSLLNGLSYKFFRRRLDGAMPKDAPLDSIDHQTAKTITDRVRKFIGESHEETFVFANYMDAHAPLNASDSAIQRFAPGLTRQELPIGVSGQKVHSRIKDGDIEIKERMYDLYHAAIWDLDRTVTPLIESAVKEGSFVVVTADHGNWFSRDSELDEERIHVPLLLFTPDKQHQVIEETVNLLSLPRTTMKVAANDDGGFDGNNLIDISEHQLSITELIHDPETPGSPVEPYGNDDQSIQYDIAAVKAGNRVDLVGGGFETLRDQGGTKELEDRIQDLRDSEIEFDPANETGDSNRDERLRQLGYLE